ncbi:class I SAM-dependent methyltransferase [Notoacmeibacter sp. MSK16QG-6]|uniref:class I SAM-dependent methyltransferase n=1 Tax=Notoacmeibacter sp. MSK16QG-6 TaxID=2957982 RepID=UPI00209C8FB0|nr:class I SAM-dependent methyltransferase [Notoacmeibacter sp. MSK16QG-6]MCP1199990.1 class I SAM-dependent methyltransferase [Notoacmeibacter sp. MSK16QG-6]
MHCEIRALRDFYASPLGSLAVLSIGRALTSVWEPSASERLIGIGYPIPWLEKFSPDAERTLCFMPAGQGAIAWPDEQHSATALVFDEELPLADSSVDRLLYVHALEHSENPRETLTEAWRVLSPGGRVVAVVPSRRGLWARFEHTPFGTGRPFSEGQLSRLLEDSNLTVTHRMEALHFPPVRRRMALRFAGTLERLGRRFWPLFAGVRIIVAEKRLYQGLPVTERASRRVFQPVLQPAGALSRQSRTLDTDGRAG